MPRKPLVTVLVLAAVAGAVLAGSATATASTLASPTFNRGWDIPSADAIAALRYD